VRKINLQGLCLVASMSRRLLGATAFVLLVASGLLFALPTTSAASTVVVSMPSGAGTSPTAAPGFKPENITVVAGVNNTVMWTNNDTVSHTVAPKSQPAGGGMPTAGSGNIPVGGTYSFTFTTPGTYDYYCTYHVWMVGSVMVRPATSPTPEFPATWLAAILFAIIAAAIVVAPRSMPQRDTKPL
jgi:plastocyanin